jgi:ribosomal protein S18 acetylase RimI-like enzyme
VTPVGTDADLLARIEAYCDAAPRAAADVEEHGAITLFVSRIPWRYSGRPRLGLAHDVGADDVAVVRARQRELGVRESFEWVHETTPSLAGAAQAAGLDVQRVPLLVLDPDAWTPARAPEGIAVRMLGASDPALADAQGAVELAFLTPGTAVGPEGPAQREVATAGLADLGFLRERMRQGLTAVAVAEDPADGPVGAGSHQPVGDVSEVLGIGTIPSARRRGLAAAVTSRLVADARERGVALIFLSAADDAVARLYERLGFRRIGTACFGRAPQA